MSARGYVDRPVVDDPRWPAGWHVRVVDETGSTNEDLLAASAELPDRSVLATHHQTVGRGRLDRRWDAPPGTNLLVSLMFRGRIEDRHQRIRQVAVAAVDAVAAVAGVEATLKWPNDVMVGDAKLAGILAQANEHVIVVGLGLNVGWAPDGAARLPDGIDPLDVLAALLRAYDAIEGCLGVQCLDVRYRELLGTLGRRVRVELAHGQVIGAAADIGSGGELVVVDDHDITHVIDVGDVVHLRPA